MNDFQGTLPEGGGRGYFHNPGGATGEYWYGQYWFMLDNNFDWGTSAFNEGDANLANVKILRIWNFSMAQPVENFVMATRGYEGSTIGYETDNVAGPNIGTFGNFLAWEKGVWHLLQFEYRDSGVNQYNGVIRVWIDGEKQLEHTALKTREDSAALKGILVLGFENSWRDSNTDHDYFYIDDAYLDTAWSRVELGDNQSYEQCSHREIQVPTSWSTTNIQITTNTGSFAPGSTVYLFVVGADGRRSDGFGPLKAGEFVDLGPPSIPGTPIIPGPDEN
jgi:hypothetical protein